MDKRLLEIIDLIDVARAKMIEYKKGLGPDTGDENSEGWLLHGMVEEVDGYLYNAIQEIETCTEAELDLN